MNKDLVIIGGGPGGYVAAIRGAQLGLDVLVIEKDSLGGTCLNRGCIPTKALYTNAKAIDVFKESEDFGIIHDGFKLDIDKIMNRKDEVVKNLVTGIEKLFIENKITLIKGIASFVDKNNINVITENGEMNITFKDCIIATGSIPSNPPIKTIEDKRIITSDEILELREIPKNLIVVGSGVIGMEFASIYNTFGSNVTVVSSTLLKRVDKDITKRLPSILKKKGLKILDGLRASEIYKKEDNLCLVANNKKDERIEIEGDYILLASGRRSFYDGLNLENVGIKTDKNGILVDKEFKTNIDNIYAIGDVIGKVMLAHVASHQGIEVVESLVGIKNNIHSVVPDCIFITPEIAYVGLTEEQAIEKGFEILVSRFPFSAIGKALAMNETEGFVKMIAMKDTNQILGVHIMGPHASDLIHEMAIAINNKLSVYDVINTIHAHPTLSEAIHESALGIFERSIHIAPIKKKTSK